MSYFIGQEEIEAASNILAKGDLDRYIHGKKSLTYQFEKKFSQTIKTEYSLAVSSGTAALICGLAAMEIGSGDEVIIPGFTYIATALAVLAVGAIPVIAEIDESLTISPADIKEKISSRTKAIIPVHMHGLPCAMNDINSIAKSHNLWVLEDVAQACGGSYHGKMLGSIGHGGAFSFNHYKILTCGEGGALSCNDSELWQKAHIQHHGGCMFEPRSLEIGVNKFAGWNFRMSEISSAIMLAQLNRLDTILASLRAEKKLLHNQIKISANRGTLNPTHDELGDCGTHMHILMNSENDANKLLVEAKQHGIGNIWLAHTLGHVYSDWEPILNQTGAHHEGRNPFNLASENIKDSNRSLEKTSSILKRTIVIPTKFNRPIAELEALINKLNCVL